MKLIILLIIMLVSALSAWWNIYTGNDVTFFVSLFVLAIAAWRTCKP